MERKDCIFCRIADRDIPSPLLYEDGDIVAFNDLHPLEPVHVLIIPKKHIASLAEMTEEDSRLLGKMNWVVKQLAEELGIAESGYRVVCNCRADSGQEVPHLHYHLLGGHFLGPFAQEQLTRAAK